MQQHKLITSTFVFLFTMILGSNASAAPSIAYKKQMTVPTVPSTVIKQVQSSTWRYTTTKGTDFKPVYESFKNVVTQKPELLAEMDCSGVMYRAWKFNVDLKETRKTYPQIVPIARSNEEYYGRSKFVFEARTPKTTKWMLDPKANSTYSKNLFLGCSNKDMILSNGYTSEALYSAIETQKDLRIIPFNDFTNAKQWNNPPLAKINSYSEYYTGYQNMMSVDGIKQIPGKLTLYKYANEPQAQISGNSQVMTFTKGFHIHTIPHYRDLNAIASPNEDITIYVETYRLSDGYAVKETIYKINTLDNYSSSLSSTTYYRIKNGEASYRIVDSLPYDSESTIYTYRKGINLLSYNWQTVLTDYHGNEITVHGLPTGHNTTESVYDVTATKIWETKDQVYMRYLITDKFSGKQQYWEATVNKQ